MTNCFAVYAPDFSMPSVLDIDFDRDGVTIPGLVPPPNDEIEIDLALD